ncbi:MAG: transporter substrate-binding domain-containing protein [Campylobacteraceae bacterium]|nr:transporter substrate-binding domain-containing protein [Campylobacteraceae bacterium]
MLRFKIVFIIFSFSCFLLAQPLKKNFTVSFDPNYAPFSYIENKQPQGLLIDYWKLWAEKNNYKINFINGKLWQNSIDLVKNERVDFFLGTETYKKWMKGSKPFYKSKTSLFTHKDTSKSFEKHASYIIGIIGSDYEKVIKRNFPNSMVIVYQDYDNAVNDLISKKIDLLYEDKIAIEFYTLQKRQFHKIKPIELLSKLSNIQAIARDNKLIDTFNKGFNNLSKEELYDIESKWIINEKFKFYNQIKDTNLTKEELNFIKNTDLNVSISRDWKPFVFKSKANIPAGISSEIWQLLEEKLNLNTKYAFFNSFTRQLKSIKQKHQDIIFSTGKTQDREEYALFTKPYISFPISIVTLKDENFIENIEQIQDKKIAVGENFTAHKLLKEKYPHLKLLLVKSPKEGLSAVENENAFAYIDIKPTLTYNIGKLGFETLKISGNTNLNFDLRVMIRKDYPLLHSALDKAINTLDEQELESIINKWDNVQFEDNFNYNQLWVALFVIFTIVIILVFKNQTSIKQNRLLKEKVEERTKELKQLNESLEKKVEDKTKKLKRANYLLDEAQKIAHLGSFQYEIKKDELYWSNEHFKMFGLYPNQIKPTVDLLLSYVHEDDKRIVKSHLNKLVSTKNKLVNEFRIIINKKTIKYLQITSKITKFDEKNNPLLIIGTILDITKIKELEQEKREKDTILAQQSKMAAMGEMLENIAHQWRQPLSVISTVSTGMQLNLEIDNELPKQHLLENVRAINEHTQYLSKTIDDFRNFFNPNKENTHFDIASCIDKSLYLITSKIKSSNIKLTKKIENISITTLESELTQVLLNIFNNAIDALNQNNIEDKQIYILAHKENNNIVICIKDSAGGVPEKIQSRIFEPYFTTKHKSQGTGIGLYMSSQIITKHLHGTIKLSNEQFILNSKPYFGANFKITFPENS